MSVKKEFTKLLQAEFCNCSVGRQWQPKHGEATPARLSVDAVSQKFADLNSEFKQIQELKSKLLTDCGKAGLCDERGHGSRFWCGTCGKRE